MRHCVWTFSLSQSKLSSCIYLDKSSNFIVLSSTYSVVFLFGLDFVSIVLISQLVMDENTFRAIDFRLVLSFELLD